MILKSIRTTLSLAGLFTAAVALHAATPVTVDVPFSFMASGKSLPAGEYRIEPMGQGAILIAGSDSKMSVLALVTADTSGVSTAGVTFDRSGAEPRLSTIATSTGTWQIVASKHK